MFIFGLGYTASRLAKYLRSKGWQVSGTGRAGDVAFADEDGVKTALEGAEYVLSSVPPDPNGGFDPVLTRYGANLSGQHLSRQVPSRPWLGYLSSTGVYGDRQGAWVDEHTPTGTGRRTARGECDAAWLAKGARIFRLPGIYGPGRSMLDRVREGRAHRIDLPEQVFSRIHVEDIVSAIIAAIDRDAPPGAYNIADDLPTSQNAVVEEACRLVGLDPPPLQTLEEANLSPMGRGFYAENRRVANGKAKRLLGWRPRYPTYVEGLRGVLEAGKR